VYKSQALLGKLKALPALKDAQDFNIGGSLCTLIFGVSFIYDQLAAVVVLWSLGFLSPWGLGNTLASGSPDWLTLLFFLQATLLSERLNGMGIVQNLELHNDRMHPLLISVVAALLTAAVLPSKPRTEANDLTDTLRGAAGRIAYVGLAGTIVAEMFTGSGILTLLDIETGVEVLSDMEGVAAFVAMLLLTGPRTSRSTWTRECRLSLLMILLAGCEWNRRCCGHGNIANALPQVALCVLFRLLSLVLLPLSLILSYSSLISLFVKNYNAGFRKLVIVRV
jgi:hypothetical protein